MATNTKYLKIFRFHWICGGIPEILRLIILCALITTRSSILWMLFPLAILFGLIGLLLISTSILDLFQRPQRRASLRQWFITAFTLLSAPWRQAFATRSCQYLLFALSHSLWWIIIFPLLILLSWIVCYGIFPLSALSWSLSSGPTDYGARRFFSVMCCGYQFVDEFVGEILRYVLDTDSHQISKQRVMASNYYLMTMMNEEIAALDPRRNRNHSLQALDLVNFMTEKHNENVDGQGLRSVKLRAIIGRVRSDIAKEIQKKWIRYE